MYIYSIYTIDIQLNILLCLPTSNIFLITQNCYNFDKFIFHVRHANSYMHLKNAFVKIKIEICKPNVRRK